MATDFFERVQNNHDQAVRDSQNNFRQASMNLQNQKHATALNDKLISATKEVAKSNDNIATEISKLKEENAKLVTENTKLVNELKATNESIKHIKVPKWHFWVLGAIALGSMLAAIASAIISAVK